MRSHVKGNVLHYLQQLCLRQPSFSSVKPTFQQIGPVTSLAFAIATTHLTYPGKKRLEPKIGTQLLGYVL